MKLENVKWVNEMYDTGHKESLNIMLTEEVDMSKDGIKQWSPKLRRKVRRKVFKWRKFFTHNNGNPVLVEEIENMEKLKEWFYEYCYTGRWHIGTNSKGKTKTGLKWLRIATADIVSKDDASSIVISNTWRLKRFGWFWKGDERVRRL